MSKMLLLTILPLMLIAIVNAISGKAKLIPDVEKYVDEITADLSSISDERKILLDDLAEYINGELEKNNEINLTFICTHNSRRSHMSQIWAQTAAYYYGYNNVKCWSGGTEATAFNPRAVKALKKAGLDIRVDKEGDNPVYSVKYAEDAEPLKAFSKKFIDKFNPQENFAAVMTCSEADEACPYVPGADSRFSITYIDPKNFDGTELEEKKYDERCRQIATEMFYVFTRVKQ